MCVTWKHVTEILHCHLFLFSSICFLQNLTLFINRKSCQQLLRGQVRTVSGVFTHVAEDEKTPMSPRGRVTKPRSSRRKRPARRGGAGDGWGAAVTTRQAEPRLRTPGTVNPGLSHRSRAVRKGGKGRSSPRWKSSGRPFLRVWGRSTKARMQDGVSDFFFFCPVTTSLY